MTTVLQKSVSALLQYIASIALHLASSIAYCKEVTSLAMT